MSAPLLQPGPTRSALNTYWPQLCIEAKYVREAIMLDRAGATERDVERALAALESSRAQSEWLYFRTVVLENMSQRWPDVLACPK